MYRTRFGTYQVNIVVEETSLISNVQWRPLKVPEAPPEELFFPTPWDCTKKKHLLDLLRLKHGVSLKTFTRILSEISYPQAVQSSIFQIIPEDYYPMLGTVGMMYDLIEAKTVSSIDLETILNDKEWEVLQLIIKLFLNQEDLAKISPTQYLQRMIQNLSASENPIHPLEFFRLLQALCTSQSNSRLVDFKFQEIESLLRLSLNQSPGFKEIPYYLIWRNELSSVQLAKEISLILLSHENLLTLIDDPNSPFSSPIELAPELCQKYLGLTPAELRYNLVQSLLLSQESQLLKSSGPEIYLWSQMNGPNVLSRESLNDLLSRLTSHPRKGWETERIKMTAQRLSSPNYSLAKFIREYDEEIIKEREGLGKKLTRLLQSLGPLYSPETDSRRLLPKMITEDAFRIPLLSPRGVLTLLSLIDYSGPLWLPAFLYLSIIRSNHENSIFKGNVVGIQLAGAPGPLIFKSTPEFLATS